MKRTYIAIDLKSFYASAECVARGLDPLTANLVVADPSRTEKTICLAVSPALKSFGIPGRARLFEAVQKVNEVNAERKRRLRGRDFTGTSCNIRELNADPGLKLSYVTAPPRMSYYMEISTKIYQIYLRYVAPEDIHVYSVDEVFIDATAYLNTSHMNPQQFAMKMIRNVLDATGITATAGIGPNLYLCKIAMDVEAKHIPADRNGVRIAALDEMSYREKLWEHRPITDFWRVGKGIADKLEKFGMLTMGDVAEMSVKNEELLYKLFGVNAELLIDHAWGYEPCTIQDIKNYKPQSNSISSGQVLKHPYTAEKGRLIVREMTDLLVLDLVEKGLVTDQMDLVVGYDIENMKNGAAYGSEVKTDRYGRQIPKEAHASVNLKRQTSSTRLILDAVTALYDRIVDPNLTVRRMYVTANRVTPREEAESRKKEPEQLDLFTDYALREAEEEAEEQALSKERSMQQAMIEIKKKYGKNAILKGMNLEEGAMTRERNSQVGGHKA